MKVASPVLSLASTALFRALYKNVGEGVFLYHPGQAQIIEGNCAFRARTGVSEGGNLNLPIGSVFRQLSGDLLPDEVPEAILLPAGLPTSPVQLHVSEVTLNGEQVYLCVIKESVNLHTSHVLAAAEVEKKALLNEIYHRVKNNLNVIISLLSLQLNRVEDPQLRHLLTESKSRIFALAMLQERLYYSPRLSEVKANDYLTSLTQSVIATFKEPKQRLNLTTQTHECWLNVDILVPLGLLVHELVANAVLHAYSKEAAGEILLQFSVQEAGNYTLVIQDSGRGFPAGSTFTSFQSLGSKLIISLSRQIKARLQLESKPAEGSRVTIEFTA